MASASIDLAFATASARASATSSAALSAPKASIARRSDSSVLSPSGIPALLCPLLPTLLGLLGVGLAGRSLDHLLVPRLDDHLLTRLGSRQPRGLLQALQ